jgi:hypothetical protein
MPSQPEQQAQGPQPLLIDLTGLAGLAPKFFGDANTPQGYGNTGNPNRRAIGGKGQMAGGYWNPFRIAGYMAPPTSMSLSSFPIVYSDATYKQDTEWKATLYDSLGTNGTNGLGVWAATDTTIFTQYYIDVAYNGPRFNTQVDAGFGTGAKIQDLQVYQVNGVNKILFSYQNTGGSYGDIGIIAPDGSSANTTYFSGTASGGGTYLGVTSNLVMVPSADNYLYILDTNNVHRLDGTALTGGSSGTVTQGVLIFPAECFLADAVDFNGSLWIVAQTNQLALNGGSFSTNAFNEHKIDVYAWNRQITTASSIQAIPVTGMQSVRKIYVTPDGDLRLIGIAANRTVQIRRYNGTTFEIMQELPIWAYPPYRGSCTFVEGMFAWMGRDGKFYAHGKVAMVQGGTLSSSVNYSADQIFILGDASPLWSGSDSTVGAVIYDGVGSSGTASNPPTSVPGLYFSYSSGSNHKTYQWIMNGVGTLAGGSGGTTNVVQYADAGNPYTLVQRLPGLAKVNYVRIWCMPQGTGGATQVGTLSIYKNQSASALAGGAVAITQTDVQRGYKYIPIGDKGVGTFALQFGISWATNVTLGDSTDWLPYEIEVDYELDTKLK